MSTVTRRSQVVGGCSVRLLGLYLADNRVCPDSVQSSSGRRRRGCPCSCARSVPRGTFGLAPPGLMSSCVCCGRSGSGFERLLSGGDGRVPGDASGDHDVRPAQQRRRAGGPGLLAGQPVVLPGGQIPEPSGKHRVVRQGRPDRPPGRQPQRGAALAGDAGVLPWWWPLALSRGHSPGCLTTARGLPTRAISPVSARMAAAPTAVSPPIEVTSSVRPSSSRTGLLH
jgi:hypothetical protein